MWEKKLLCFVIPLMLLGGCGTDTVVGKTHKQVQSSETKKEKLTKENYAPRLTSLAVDFTKEILEIQTIAASDKSNAEKMKEVNKKIDDILKMAEKFKNIEAPKEYETVQKGIEKAVDYYSKGFKYQKEAIKDQSNKEKLTKSLEQIQLGDEAWRESYNQLQEIQLDLIQEPVTKSKESKPDIQNISKDGKELVGTWVEKTKNRIEQSLIFHPDGIFENYVEDTYPTKDNYVKGHWKYDSKTNKLKLTGEKMYRDGELEQDFMEVRTFVVKSFQGDKLELEEPEAGQSGILERR
ncbi:DUF3994 domain-containing protein [Cytobacillus sp. Hz8]|uniref:DUF3994 domain-containing protein n=1 Tax=Cytobacillus sp. Hz8 TaxID=3347168 RepID=UPI0035DB0440